MLFRLSLCKYNNNNNSDNDNDNSDNDNNNSDNNNDNNSNNSNNSDNSIRIDDNNNNVNNNINGNNNNVMGISGWWLWNKVIKSRSECLYLVDGAVHPIWRRLRETGHQQS